MGRQIGRNVDVFLICLNKAKERMRMCHWHGDFVIRHMYESEKIGVIDGEHASAFGPLYYVVAQFYLRLKIDYNEGKLSKKYLIEFYLLLTPIDRDGFWEELKPILTQRFICVLSGFKGCEVKDKFLEKIGKDIRNDSIL